MRFTPVKMITVRHPNSLVVSHNNCPFEGLYIKTHLPEENSECTLSSTILAFSGICLKI